MFVSGQLALTPGAHELVGEGITEQTEQVFANLKAILEAAGSSLDRVVKTTVYLRNLDDFRGMNEVYAGTSATAAGPGDARGVGAPVGRARRDRRDCPREPTDADSIDDELTVPFGVRPEQPRARRGRLTQLGRRHGPGHPARPQGLRHRHRRRGRRDRVRGGPRWGRGEVTAHGRFGTAVVRFSDGRHWDVVTARRESYAGRPRLPDVEAGRSRTTSRAATSRSTRSQHRSETTSGACATRTAAGPTSRPERSAFSTTGRSSTIRRGSSARSATRTGSASAWTTETSASPARDAGGSSCSAEARVREELVAILSARTGSRTRSSASPTSASVPADPGRVGRSRGSTPCAPSSSPRPASGGPAGTSAPTSGRAATLRRDGRKAIDRTARSRVAPVLAEAIRPVEIADLAAAPRCAAARAYARRIPGAS